MRAAGSILVASAWNAKIAIPAYTPDSETAQTFGRSPSFRNFMSLINKLNNNRCNLADIITELTPAQAQASAAE